MCADELRSDGLRANRYRCGILVGLVAMLVGASAGSASAASLLFATRNSDGALFELDVLARALAPFRVTAVMRSESYADNERRANDFSRTVTDS